VIEVSVEQAQADLERLVEAVARGVRVVILRDGVAVVELVAARG
jgi:antitoxin (DNA-binding transcriptional repressor) of toxin-antitoxin stability system